MFGLIIAGVVKLLGSAGVGTIFGGIMGYFNRKVDLEYKREEYKDRAAQRAHELTLRDKDLELAKQEGATKIQTVSIEAESAAQQAASAALAESYSFAKPTRGTRMDAYAQFIRPTLSMFYALVTAIGAGYILYFAFYVAQIKLTDAQLYELVLYVISWFAFVASAAIGWWFAMRAGKPPIFPGSKP